MGGIGMFVRGSVADARDGSGVAAVPTSERA